MRCDGWPRMRFVVQRQATNRWLVLLTIILVLGGCVVPGRGESPAPAPAATVATFAGNSAGWPLLVDAVWLGSRRDDANLRVLDLSALATYQRGHIPGASHAWWQDTMDRYEPVYGMAVSEDRDPGRRARLLEWFGVGPETFVVAYDDDRNRFAARLVWFLRYLGHERASVLDGGLAAWRGAGGDVDTATHETPEVVAKAPDPQSGYLIGTRELRDRLDDPSLIILDVRTPEEADDDINGTLPKGRIPGAIVVPWTDTLRDDVGRLKDPAELARLYRQAGVVPDRDKRIIVYARFGVEAGQTWWVLKLLGYPYVRIYDAGWAGWAAQPAVPIDE